MAAPFAECRMETVECDAGRHSGAGHWRSWLLLLAAGFLLCSFGLMWGLPNLFDFAQDSVVPYGSLAQIGTSFEKVTTSRYPPFHFLLLRICFLPARALLAIPSILETLKVASTLFILTARLVSVAMALGVLALLRAIGRRLWGESAGAAAALLFILSPVTLYYAKNANLDIPYVFWLAAALLVYVRILEERRRRDYLWLGILAALAVCTKDQAYGFILFMPLALLPVLPASRRDALACAALGLLGFALPFALIHNVLFDFAGFWRHVKMILGPASEGWREVAFGPVGQARLLVETLLRLMDAWTPAGLALVVVGIAVAWRQREKRGLWTAMLMPLVSYFACFLTPIGYVLPRFTLPMMLALAPFAGLGAVWLWRRPWPGGAAKVLTAALVGWIGLAGLSLDYVMSEYARYDAQIWLENHASAATRLRYVGADRDMPRFNKPLDARPVEPEELASLQPPADLLVLSFEQGQPATGSRSTRLGAVLRRRLGNWGLVRGGGGKGFYESLVAGELGYKEVARFESPIGAFVPEVAESVNRTIVILARISHQSSPSGGRFWPESRPEALASSRCLSRRSRSSEYQRIRFRSLACASLPQAKIAPPFTSSCLGQWIASPRGNECRSRFPHAVGKAGEKCGLSGGQSRSLFSSP